MKTNRICKLSLIHSEVTIGTQLGLCSAFTVRLRKARVEVQTCTHFLGENVTRLRRITDYARQMRQKL